MIMNMQHQKPLRVGPRVDAYSRIDAADARSLITKIKRKKSANKCRNKDDDSVTITAATTKRVNNKTLPL